jgi:hypothetical protein
MWSVKFKWLYAIFLVVFTAVMWAAILFDILDSSKLHTRLLQFVLTWVVGFSGILLWWYVKSRQAEM